MLPNQLSHLAPPNRATQATEATTQASSNRPQTKAQPLEDMRHLTFEERLQQAQTERLATPYNFCAGPGTVYQRAIENVSIHMLSFKGTGIGLQEMSHRDIGGPVQSLLMEARDRARSVLNVPDTHEVLFMTGGAHFQFDALAQNLMHETKSADYADSGFWSQRAQSHIERAGEGFTSRGVNILEQNEQGQTIIASPDTWDLNPNASYVHICDNETITGIQFKKDPTVEQSDQRPLVTDATSSLLCRKMDIRKYGIIYASGGKNIGPAGATLVIVRKDLMKRNPNTPIASSYDQQAQYSNLYNTPNMIAVDFVNETLKIIEEQGLDYIEQRAHTRSAWVYNAIDQSNGFFSNNVAADYRSITTIPFRILDSKGQPNVELEEAFVKEASERGFQQIRGHHSVGGLRISLYNPVPDEAIETFTKFMTEFAKANG